MHLSKEHTPSFQKRYWVVGLEESFPPTNQHETHPKNSTTSFLTATALVHACRAGITAAAGTRLALYLLLVKRFKLYSFQLQSR